jgi:1,4-dihydroxy-2-naphthoate polyprenyltransferase
MVQPQSADYRVLNNPPIFSVLKPGLSNLKTWYKILNGTYDMHTEPVQNLDRVSRWLIATRSVVFVMTVNSVIIAALLYIIHTGLSLGLFLPLALVLVGLVLAHATSNLFNDYWDAKHGIDTSKDYFRPAYMPHPLLSGIMSPRGLFSHGLAQIVGWPRSRSISPCCEDP